MAKIREEAARGEQDRPAPGGQSGGRGYRSLRALILVGSRAFPQGFSYDLKTRRFETAAEAVRYVIEELRTPKAFGVWLQVGDERFNSSEIQRPYEADDYPLRKPE